MYTKQASELCGMRTKRRKEEDSNKSTRLPSASREEGRNLRELESKEKRSTGKTLEEREKREWEGALPLLERIGLVEMMISFSDFERAFLMDIEFSCGPSRWSKIGAPDIS